MSPAGKARRPGPSRTGETDFAGATRLADPCIEAGIELFDTDDV